MRTSLLAALTIVGFTTVAAAQTVPSFANPNPEQPIATNGTSLDMGNRPRVAIPAARGDFQALFTRGPANAHTAQQD